MYYVSFLFLLLFAFFSPPFTSPHLPFLSLLEKLVPNHLQCVGRWGTQWPSVGIQPDLGEHCPHGARMCPKVGHQSPCMLRKSPQGKVAWNGGSGPQQGGSARDDER